MIDDIFRLFSVIWLQLEKPIKERCRSNDVAPSYFPLQNCCKGDRVVSGVYLEVTYGLSSIVEMESLKFRGTLTFLRKPALAVFP